MDQHIDFEYDPFTAEPQLRLADTGRTTRVGVLHRALVSNR